MRYTLNNSVSHSMVPKVGGGGAAHSQPMTMVLAAASPSKRVKPPARRMPPFSAIRGLALEPGSLIFVLREI